MAFLVPEEVCANGARIFAWGGSPCRRRFVVGPKKPMLHRKRTSSYRSINVCIAAALVEEAGIRREEDVSAGARNLVIAVDESKDALRAFNWALSHIYRPGDVLHILHVLPFVDTRPASGQLYYVPPADQALEEVMVEHAQQFIKENFVAEAEKLGITFEVDVVKGTCLQSTGQAVCSAAEKLQAAMLIVHTHRKSMVEKIMMGSVSAYCANHAKVPTLLLH
eukprot:jgi/Botrbrau1/7173/Bobra.0300s0006.1